VTIAHDVIGNELGEANGGIRIQRNCLVQADLEVLGRIGHREVWRKHQFVELSGVAVARLIKTNAFINQRIVYHDLLVQDLLPVFNTGQIRPPAFWSTVGIVLLSGAIAADGKRQTRGCCRFATSTWLDCWPRVRVMKRAPAIERIDNAAEENEKQTGMHDVYRHSEMRLRSPKREKLFSRTIRSGRNLPFGRPVRPRSKPFLRL
jgi:hypothetical protein